MDCLGCNLIKTAPVTLRDVRVVCSSCEAWRLECEARTILKRRDRKEYLEKVRQRRGVDAAVELRNEMLAIKEGRQYDSK
jgi:hypothetical protein